MRLSSVTVAIFLASASLAVAAPHVRRMGNAEAAAAVENAGAVESAASAALKTVAEGIAAARKLGMEISTTQIDEPMKFVEERDPEASRYDTEPDTDSEMDDRNADGQPPPHQTEQAEGNRDAGSEDDDMDPNADPNRPERPSVIDASRTPRRQHEGEKRQSLRTKTQTKFYGISEK